MSALGIDLKLLAIQIINFVILFVLLKRWFYPPFLKFLDERAKKIEESLIASEKMRSELKSFEVQKAEELNVLKGKSQVILSEVQKEAQFGKKQILEEAENEAKLIIESAKKQIELENNKVTRENREEVVETAVELSKKVLGGIDEEKAHQLIIQALGEKWTE